MSPEMSSFQLNWRISLIRLPRRLASIVFRNSPPMRASGINQLDPEELSQRELSDLGLIDGRYDRAKPRQDTAFDAARKNFISRGL
ncbi:hypothetical protein ACFSE1_11400 [Rhizobium helianthi]|uniref:DUF1127 domain-containing protein n=1 Tax=Rhizobium helianthi TaxID=1132695 RepID=A0ABW4M4I1_9HYPH